MSRLHFIAVLLPAVGAARQVQPESGPQSYEILPFSTTIVHGADFRGNARPVSALSDWSAGDGAAQRQHAAVAAAC